MDGRLTPAIRTARPDDDAALLPLLAAARRTAATRGGAKLSLRELSGNEHAIRAYTSAGFAVEGVVAGEFVIEGEPVDDVLMATTL